MRKLWAIIINELKLLWRDRAGLLVLFAMPAALVLVITLVQENVMKTVGESTIDVLVVDKDGQAVGQEIEDRLNQSPALAITPGKADGRIDTKTVRSQVLHGDYQAAVIIPKGLTKALTKRAKVTIEHLMAEKDIEASSRKPLPDILVYFDPTVMGGFRSGLKNALAVILMGLEVKAQLTALSKLLPQQLEKQVEEQFGDMVSESMVNQWPAFNFKLSDTRLLTVTEVNPADELAQARPNSVQQNVPAWALFGIFFIAVPIAGSLIKERQNGTYRRLMSFPISPVALLAGKMAAYMAVGLMQLVLIGLIGRYVLPALGTPMLSLGTSAQGILLMAISAILAAAGFGILLGTVSGSYEQASMLGPITIVIAAAIGGIMVPVYVMPTFMQTLSRLSPLAWGLNGFLDLFVRGADAVKVLPQAAKLFTFCGACLTVAWLVFSRRLGTGGH